MSVSEGRRPYTGFGKMLRGLMSEQDIRSWTQLSKMIYEKTGEHYPHQSMSKYASGASGVPVAFVQDFADTLELSKKKRTDLAEQLAYHSLPPEDDQRSA